MTASTRAARHDAFVYTPHYDALMARWRREHDQDNPEPGVFSHRAEEAIRSEQRKKPIIRPARRSPRKSPATKRKGA